MDGMSPGARALWTFLFATLVAPFFAAVIIFVLSIGSGLFGFGPPSLKNLALSELFPLAARRGLESYIWAAFPAGLAGLALAALVVWRGTFGWLEAAIAGAIAATLAAVSAGGQAINHVAFLGLIAACVSVGCRAILLRAKVLDGNSDQPPPGNIKSR